MAVYRIQSRQGPQRPSPVARLHALQENGIMQARLLVLSSEMVRDHTPHEQPATVYTEYLDAPYGGLS